LRDFVTCTSEYFVKKQEELGRENISDLIPIAYGFYKLNPNNFPLPEGLSKDDVEDLIKSINIEVQDSEDKSGFQIIFHDQTKAESFNSVMKSIKRGSSQIQHIYDVTLVSSISSVEWFLSCILHEYFNKFPDAVEGNDKVLSLKDLKLFDNIEEAKTSLVDSYVENILRGSFDDLIKFFKNRLKLSCGYLNDFYISISDAFQIRNLIVHNGGIVNQIFLSKVTSDVYKRLKPGARVFIDIKYLDNILTCFERCFILIASELWKKLDPDDTNRSNVLINISYGHLVAERWEIAEGLSHFIINDAKQQQINKFIAQINYWQSIKWQGRFNEIKETVMSADYSATNELFPLSKAVLLDDFDTFFKLLPNAIKKGDLPKGALTNWPLFREIRKNDAIKPYLIKDKPTVKLQKPSIRSKESK
jgi:hypothetical protein